MSGMAAGMAHELAWAHSHATALLTAAGTVLAVLLAVAAWRSARSGSLAAGLRLVAIPLVLLYEAQGLFGVTLRLHVPREIAYALAGVTTAVILTFGAYAREHHRKHGNLGPNGRMMWWVAIPMGLIVAANAGSLAGVGLRITLPLLSVMAFRAAYAPDEPDGPAAREGSWRLTPRRLGVALGLLDPADTDLTTVHAERRVRQLTLHAAGYHRGAPVLRPWHEWRLERLALTADDVMVSEAARRVRRVGAVIASTNPATGTADDTAAAPAAAIGAGPPAAIGDVPAAGAGGSSGRDIAPRTISAVARVRRKGAASATDDEVRAAIRELLAGDPETTNYRVCKELRGPKGTIGDKRAGRLLAEVQNGRPDLRAVAGPAQ